MTNPTPEDLRMLAGESGRAIDRLLEIAARWRAGGDEAGAAAVEETISRLAQFKRGAQNALNAR